MSRRRLWLIAVPGAVLVAAFAVLGSAADLTRRLPFFLTVYACAFAAYGVGIALVLRAGGPRKPVLIAMAVVAVAARVATLPAAPAMSTDVYRYVWEGRIIAEGYNPFAHAPDDSALAHLRDQNFERINHRHLETIYPPAAQAVFAIAAAIAPNATAQKVAFTLFDLATIAVLMSLLSLLRRDPAAAVIYAWNPLVIFETAHSGHVDAVGVFFLMLGLLLVVRGRVLWGFVILGISFLTKYLAALAGLYSVIRRSWFLALLVAVVVVVVGYLPFASAGAGLVSSLQRYGMEWRFNSPPYLVVVAVFGKTEAARYVMLAIVATGVLISALRQAELLRFMFFAIGTVLLLVPTLYPWYLVWIVPFLVLYRSRAWILFTGMVFTSYWVWVVFERTGQWVLPPWVYVVEFVPLYAMLAWEWRRGRGREVAA